MLDLALLGFLAVLLGMGLRRPFIWVLAYLYVDIVGPQKIGWSLLPAIPVSLICFAAAFAGWLLADSKEGSRFTFRQFLMLLLLVYCGMTTLGADFPEAAQVKWDWVWKALVFAIFLPLALRTKLRLEAAVLFIVLSVGAITINGGIKTVFGGGGYGTLSLLVQENAGLYEGSIISAVAISIIPLILWLAKNGTVFKPDVWVKLFAAALIFACLLIPVGTAARTGLVCIVVLAVLLLRSVRHRFVYIGAAALALAVAVPFLPQSFTDRMATIQNHEGDQSASTRVAVWMWTLDYVQENPLGGGFDAFLSNSFTYNTRVEKEEGGTTVVEYQQVTDVGRAYHSSYFELLGEQGYPGFLIWMLLQGLGVLQMERIRRFYARRKDAGEHWQGSLANALQQAQLIFLVGAMFVGIGYQPFIFMLVGLQCALWTHVRLHEPEFGKRRRAVVPPAAIQQPAE
jgi:probable O-glycosylation ligase (exosortase A-associated)